VEVLLQVKATSAPLTSVDGCALQVSELLAVNRRPTLTTGGCGINLGLVKQPFPGSCRARLGCGSCPSRDLI
jgi:hypothetical protein